MVDVDLDIDIWRYGRGPNGRLDTDYLKVSYPYIQLITAAEMVKLEQIAKEHITQNHNGQMTWFCFQKCIFFQDRKDMELCRALLYVY